MHMTKRNVLMLIIAFCVIFSAFFVLHRKPPRSYVSYTLKQLSIEEQAALEWFFRRVIASDTFGYVLFGQKPLAVATFGEPKAKPYWIDDWIDHIPSSFCCDNLKMIRGREVWEKHQHLFPMINFAFVSSKNFIDNGMSALVFINKKAFLKTVRQNLNDFRNVLGEKTTPESLLNEVLHSHDIFGGVLKNHQGLIGTVLGYGRHNAWLFHKRELIWKKMYRERGEKMGEPRVEELEEYFRLDQLLKLFKNGTAQDFNPFSLGLPYFVADLQHPETKKLRLEYERTYRKIMDSYADRNFLQTTLERLLSE